MPPLHCPACQSSLAPNDTICPTCGRVLTSGAPPTTTVPAPVTAPVLQPGQQLAHGLYTVQRLLSKGGMGSIYLATDRQAFDRLVVIKAMIDYFDPSDPQQVQVAQQRFLDEARTLATLRHPAIPQIYSYFQDGPHNYIVMEYIEGRDLASGLTRSDPATDAPIAGSAYPHHQVLRWGIALCRVLEYLASREPSPVVHHDIKPANLLLDSASGDIRLVDFGTAKARLLVQAGGGVGLHKTSVYGTQGYAAPEQYQGQSEPRSDVYALAATLYHLATDDDPGQHPFTFPKLGDLGAFGELLGAALEHKVAQRPTAATLRQQCEHLRDGIGQQSMTTPDGLVVGTVAELVHWCGAHWDEAQNWLYAGLPQQIEIRWGDSRTAHALRSVVAAQPDQHLGLDAALRLLDPALTLPHVVYDPPMVDVGTTTPSDAAPRQLRVTNHGPGYALLDLVAPTWATIAPAQVALPPGAAAMVALTLHVQPQHTLGRFNDAVAVQSQHGDVSPIPVTAQVVLRSPDGAEFTTIPAFVAWCQTHWGDAVRWYRAAPSTALVEQLAPLYPALAANRRAYIQPAAAIDTLLATLSPTAYAQSVPKLSINPPALDVHALIKHPQTFVITNTSQRYLDGKFAYLPWLQNSHMTLALAPQTSKQITVTLRRSQVPVRGQSPAALTLHADVDAVLTLPIVGTLPVWRRLWLRYPRALMVIVVLCVVLLAFAANRVNIAVTQAQHYNAGVAAFEANDFAAAREAFGQALDGQGNYRDANALLSESYYRPFVQAVAATQWDTAAKLAVRLEARTPYYRDAATIVDSTPELADRVMAQRWQSGDVQRVASIRDAHDATFVRGGRLLVYQDDAGLVVDHLDTGAQQRLPNDDERGLFGVEYAVSPDARTVVVTPISGSSTIWHIDTNTVTALDVVGLSPVAFAGSEYVYQPFGATLWRASDGAKAQILPTGKIVAASTDGQLLTVINAGTLELWQQTGRTQEPFAYVGPVISAVGGQVQFSPSGQSLVATTSDNNIVVWDRATLLAGGPQPAPRQRIAVDADALDGLDISPDDGMIVAQINNRPTFWTIADGRRVQTGDVYDYVFDPRGGSVVVLAYGQRQLLVIDTQSGAVQQTLSDLPPGDTGSTLSPDGAVLATKQSFGSITLQRLRDGVTLQRLGSDSASVDDMHFSPDGRTFAITDRYGVTLWRSQPPEE